jgi:hypothetical protein
MVRYSIAYNLIPAEIGRARYLRREEHLLELGALSPSLLLRGAMPSAIRVNKRVNLLFGLFSP